MSTSTAGVETGGHGRHAGTALRAAVLVGVVAAVVIGLLAWRGGGGPAPVSAGAAPSQAQPCLIADTGGPYVRSDAQGLLCGGTRLSLTGFTFYPALDGGSSAWRKPDFPQYIDHALDMGAAAGQNLVRPTDQWDKHTPGQSAVDDTVWSNMDYLLAAARARHMYVVLDLSAFGWILTSEGQDRWDASAWVPFLTWVGERYRDNSAIAFYSIAGEPTPPASSAQLTRLVDFYRTTMAALHAADPNHLIAAGGFNHMEDESSGLDWWQAIEQLPNNDIVAIKTYSQNDVSLMSAVAGFARSIGKPVVEDEFGMPQRYGDASFAGGATYNGLAAGRAEFFRTVYETGRSLGFAAFIFWNMGCQTGPDSYEVNPSTPATWAVVAQFGAAPKPVPAGPAPAPPSASQPLCP